MSFSSFIYTRKWSKMFAPITTFFTQLSKQLGLQTNVSKTTHDGYLIKMDKLSNGDLIESDNDDDKFESNSLSSRFFSFFRLSPNQHKRYLPFSSTNNYLYHQLNPNENSNSNSTLIDLPSTTNQIDDTIDFNDKYIFTTEHFLWIFLVTFLYFTWFIFIAGIGLIHIIIYLIMIILYLISDRTRRLTLAILIYLSYLLFYDALHVMPNYTVSKVHIEDIYRIEKKFFGIVSQGQLMTLNEYFKINHKPFLDIFTGICYLNWIPIPVAYSLYLYRYKSKRDYIDFAFTFLLTNLLGFVIYYIVPAAPPWYIEYYGFEMNVKTPGNPAGFKNFDRLTGIKIFSSMYSKNANIFAAIPSLHAAYPLITVLYGSLSKKLWLHIGFVLFTLSVWFSAVYSRHHYVIDVLAGGTCAVTAFLLYRLLSRIPAINRLLITYSKLI